MPTWNYDSYCNDNVMDYVQEYLTNLKKELINDIPDILNDQPSENCLEFVVGIAIYGIRMGLLDEKEILRTVRDVIDYLIEDGKFSDWVDKEKRKLKLKYERKIIANVLAGKKLKFGKIIEKPTEFKNLNDSY